MKKATVKLFILAMLMSSSTQAQTVQEGMNHLYAKRYKNALSVFDKLLAINPNNIEAIYWKGQAMLETDDIMAARLSEARQHYEKALQTTNGAPLIQVGLGHVELLEHKTSEGRQRFESALTMTRGRKGDDPVIATAIGRAIVDTKHGDFGYAVRLLEDASVKDPKNTETLLQLGNAYRKAGKGEGGGQAFQTYNKALAVNPAFGVANLRLAQLFESQRNWEQVLYYLNQAISKDPKFTAAYYELFYYHFYRSKLAEAEQYLNKYIESKLPESDLPDQFLYAQLCYVKKELDCAITKGEAIYASQGKETKPRVYRMLAQAYYDKGDYMNAKKFSRLFFELKNPDDYHSRDHKLAADIMAQTGGTPEEIYNNYIQGVELDTTTTDKIDFLKKAAAYFKEKKWRDWEAKIVEKIIELKPKPTINDYFDLTLAHYFSTNYSKSRDAALKMVEIFPDQVYGYEWAFNNSYASDTVKKDSIAVPDALNLYAFAEKDSGKYRKQYINSVRFLAAYYINVQKNKDKSLEFFRKWQAADAANATTIQGYIDAIEKSKDPKPGSRPGSATGSTPSRSTGKNIKAVSPKKTLNT